MFPSEGGRANLSQIVFLGARSVCFDLARCLSSWWMVERLYQNDKKNNKKQLSMTAVIGFVLRVSFSFCVVLVQRICFIFTCSWFPILVYCSSFIIINTIALFYIFCFLSLFILLFFFFSTSSSWSSSLSSFLHPDMISIMLFCCCHSDLIVVVVVRSDLIVVIVVVVVVVCLFVWLFVWLLLWLLCSLLLLLWCCCCCCCYCYVVVVVVVVVCYVVVVVVVVCCVIVVVCYVVLVVGLICCFGVVVLLFCWYSRAVFVVVVVIVNCFLICSATIYSVLYTIKMMTYHQRCLLLLVKVSFILLLFCYVGV